MARTLGVKIKEKYLKMENIKTNKNMRKKLFMALAGASVAVAALVPVASGALWQDTATGGDTVVKSGNLGIEINDTKMLDVSNNWDYTKNTYKDGSNPTSGEAVSDKDRMVPGDVWVVDSDVKVALEGKNLVAELGLTQDEATGGLIGECAGKDFGTVCKGAHVRHEAIRKSDGKVTSLDNGGTVTLTPKDVAESPDYLLRTTVYFDKSTPDREYVLDSLELKNLAGTLTQVR